MARLNSSKNSRYPSPLRYPGGKTFLAKFLGRIIREKGLHRVTYIEPYAGGAGAGLALLAEGIVDRVVINDLDYAIYAFWKAAVCESERFIRKLHRTDLTVETWKRQKAIYESKTPSLFALGFATFYLNRTNISGILDGGPIGGLDQKGEWKIDARFNKKNLAARIRRLGQLKKRISISRKDGVDLIDRYLDRPNTLIYLDPPYYVKGGTLYLNHFDDGSHRRLAKRLNRSPKGNWVLTYDNHRFIRNLYPRRASVRYTLHYNAYESRNGSELMVLSDSLRDFADKK